MTKQILSALKVVALALTLSLGISYALAWNSPSQQPPNGNASAPLNVSATDQTKSGDVCTTKGGTTKCLSTAGLPVGASGQTLRSDGANWVANSVIFNNGTNVGIGTATPAQKLEVNGSMKMTNRWIVPSPGVWGGDTFEVHTSNWDGATNGSYGGITGGHGYYYGGLQTGGPTGSEAAAGQLYTAGTSMLMGNVGVGTVAPVSALHVAGNGYATFGPNSAYGAYLTVGGNGRPSTDASIAATNGNLHLDARNGGYGTYLNWYASGTTGVYVGNGSAGYGPLYASDVYSTAAGKWMSTGATIDYGTCVNITYSEGAAGSYCGGTYVQANSGDCRAYPNYVLVSNTTGLRYPGQCIPAVATCCRIR